jgi:hypothetical protein
VDASWNGTISGQYTDASASAATTDETDAEKLWVDAYIELTPSTATNPTGDPHTVTATVWVDDGDGVDDDGVNDFWDAFQGALVDFTTVSDGATPMPPTAFNVPTDINGEADFTFNSNTTGTVITTASTSITVEGVNIDLITDGSITPSGGQNSDPALKIYQGKGPSISLDSLTGMQINDTLVAGTFNINDESENPAVGAVVTSWGMAYESKNGGKGRWVPIENVVDPNSTTSMTIFGIDNDGDGRLQTAGVDEIFDDTNLFVLGAGATETITYESTFDPSVPDPLRGTVSAEIALRDKVFSFTSDQFF